LEELYNTGQLNAKILESDHVENKGKIIAEEFSCEELKGNPIIKLD